MLGGPNGESLVAKGTLVSLVAGAKKSATKAVTNAVKQGAGKKAAGKAVFKGGKQTVRDKTINSFPKEFQRWFEREYKQKGDADRTYKEIKEIFDDWIDMGKPHVK